MSALTNDQLSSSLNQRIEQLYQTHLDHHPSKVTCQTFEGKLAILLEDALTRPEQLLFSQGQTELVRQVRECLYDILCPRLKDLIQEITGITVVDLLTATQLETGRVSFMVILAAPTDLASSNVSPRAEAEHQPEQDNVAP
jgi:uncharacterized protein YbcI